MNITKKILLFTIFLATIVFIVYKTTDVKNNTVETKKMKITASFYPLAQFAKQVGGEKVEVLNITPSGYEPHSYAPTPKEIVSVNKSKLFIFNGSNLDPWAQKIAPGLEKNGVVTLNMTSYFKLTESKDGKSDPHIWLDPVLVERQVRIIRDVLKRIDPVNSEVYNRNANVYLKKLSNLDKKFKTELAFCKTREAIASHSAFGYLSSRYNIDIISIAGISPNGEPSLRRLGEITKLAREKNIKYIFFETLVSPKLSKMIAGEIGAKTLILNPIEGLTDEEIRSGKNYISEMEVNLRNLKLALECK